MRQGTLRSQEGGDGILMKFNVGLRLFVLELFSLGEFLKFRMRCYTDFDALALWRRDLNMADSKYFKN